MVDEPITTEPAPEASPSAPEAPAKPAKKAAAKVTVTQASEADTARPTNVDEFLAGMTGQAFDVFAAAIGDLHGVYFKEVDVATLATVEDVQTVAAELAEQVVAECPQGRSAQVATFDIARIGQSVFIGARVRFV